MKLDEYRIALSRGATRGMEIASILPMLREFAIPTTRTAVSRLAGPLGRHGWVDMKLDPATGLERGEDNEHYRKDRVYGWIQGRTLESLVAHERWASSLPGYDLFDEAAISSSAKRLYDRLFSACVTPSGIRAFFVSDLHGDPANEPYPDGSTTLSHLFALRGLVAYASSRGLKADLALTVPALRRAVDASIRRECLDDQVKFGERGGESYNADRLGYEGQMISIGACELLYEATGEAQDLDRGVAAISSTLSIHARQGTDGVELIDAFRADGTPCLEDGRLLSNPGHAIEFAGLALQLLRKAGADAVDEAILRAGRLEARRDGDASRGASGGAPRDRRWIVSTLESIALKYDAVGRAPHGGIVRAIDAETAKPVHSFCPWWSSFEAIRTFAELYAIAESDSGRDFCLEKIRSYAATIRGVYLRASSTGIPVQTVSYDGEVVPIIPATPDIDAGYHTGMPLIDSYAILGPFASTLAGAAERELPPFIAHRLQGHIARAAPATRQMDGLRVRALTLAGDRERFLIVSADALEFGEPWASRFAARLASAYGLREGAVALIATHTHTAPAAMRLGLLDADAEFLTALEGAALEASSDAMGSLRPAELYASSARAPGLGINRRRRDPISGRVAMRPNPNGEVDDEIASLFCFGEDGKPFACLINISTHPTTLGVGISEVSADYPGYLARALRERLGEGLVAIPAQGACGDVRPAVIDSSGAEFAEGAEADINRIGRAMAEKALMSLSAIAAGSRIGRERSDGLEASRADEASGEGLGDASSWRRVGPGLELAFLKTELPLNPPPSLDELRRLIAELELEVESLKRERPKGTGFAASHEDPLGAARTYLAWARDLASSAYAEVGRYSGRTTVSAGFHRVDLGGELAILALPGEAFCRIGLELKKAARPAAAMVLGYCGGTVGYIPTADAYADGGYEVGAAHRFYGLPAPLSPAAEGLVLRALGSTRMDTTRRDTHA